MVPLMSIILIGVVGIAFILYIHNYKQPPWV